MNPKEKIDFKHLCNHSSALAIVSLSSLAIAILFCSADVKGIAICLISGVGFFYLMVRSWRYPNGWATFFSIVLVVLAVGVTSRDDGTFGGNLAVFVQHLGAIFGVAFSLLSFHKTKVLDWVTSQDSVALNKTR